MNCPQCNSPIKTVPAGVSKTTGRPYQSFQACSNRECSWKPPRANASQPAPNLEQQTQSDVLVQILHTLKNIEKLLIGTGKPF